LDPATSVTSKTPEGVGLLSIKLASGKTDADGAFTLRAAGQGDWRGYAEPSGAMAITLLSMGNGGSMLHHLRLLPPRGKNKDWTWKTPDENIVEPAPNPTGSKVDVGSRATTTARVGRPVVGLKLKSHSQGGRAAAPGTRGVYEYEYCGPFYYWVRSDANIIRTDTRIQRMTTNAKLFVQYSWDNTNNTSHEAVANIGKGKALVGTGYTSSVNNSSGADWPKYGGNTHKDAVTEWDFRAYNLWCSPVTGPDYYSGVYEWRPYKWTGGTRVAAPVNNWSCQAKWTAPISVATWVARTTSSSYTASFTIGPVSGRSLQENSSGHKLTFTPSRNTSYCGSDDYPPYASFVKGA